MFFIKVMSLDFIVLTGTKHAPSLSVPLLFIVEIAFTLVPRKELALSVLYGEM